MKICFLGMSGVRAENKELLDIGLTLPGFIERSKQIASLPHLGLLTLAGMTPNSFEIVYEERDTYNEFDFIFHEEYDLVAISALSAQIFEGYKMAEHFKKMGIKTIMGGLHITLNHLEALEYCDSVVLGEGEVTWLQVCEDLQNGILQLIYDGRNISFDLSLAPIPRFDLLNPDKYNRITVQTQRGCPHYCEFCASSIILSPKFKTKPVNKVIEELKAIQKIWEHPFIEFADDNSFVNHKYAKELLNELIPLHIKWFTETDISVANDDELLSLMAQSGCHQILIGLESPTSEALVGLEHHSDWKYKQFENYKEAIKKIQSYGITVNGTFVIGLDEHTTDIFKNIEGFVEDSGLFEVQVTYLTPFPNTPLYKRLLEENRIIKPKAWEMSTLFDINYIPKNMTINELQEGFLKLVQNIYSKSSTERRRNRFFSQLKRSKKYVVTH